MKNNTDFDKAVEALKKEQLKRLHINAGMWQDRHPGRLACSSDNYYVDLVNRLIDQLFDYGFDKPIKDFERVMAMTAAMYLEDAVNDFGVWRAFRNLYRATYGTWLPFFDCEHDDYMLDNINLEDVKFLVWQTMCRCGMANERIYSPYSPGLQVIAEKIYDGIVDEFENAPESGRIADFITRALSCRDFAALSDVATWLSVGNLMTALPSRLDELEEGAMDVVGKGGLPADTAYRSIAAVMAWREWTGPLGIPTTAWIARMCRDRGMDREAEIVSEIRRSPVDVYQIARVGKGSATLVDRDGKEFIFDNDRLPKGARPGGGVVSAIAFFKGKWRTIGLAGTCPESELPRLLENINYHENDYTDEIREAVNRIIDEHNGEQVFILKDFQAFADLLGEEVLSYITNADSLKKKFKNVVALLSRTSAPTLLTESVAYFKIPGNRKFSKKESARDGLSLLNNCIPDDVADYLQRNNLVPEIQLYTSQGGDLGREIVQNNLRFLFAFFRAYES